MASSQVQVVPSSPFGCVLKDRNRQRRCRDSNDRVARAAFKKNLKQFIREHLLIDENSQNHNTKSNVDSWVADRQADANRPCLRPLKKNDKKKNENRDEQKPPQPVPKPVVPDAATQSGTQNPGGASSLVQMWEARLNRSQSIKSCSRTSSGVSCSEIAPSIADHPAPDASSCEETLSLDWEAQSDKTGASDLPFSGPSVKGEKERVRISDIIKRLKDGNEEKTENEQQLVNNGGSELACKERRPNCSLAVPEHRGFQLQQIVSSPRLRGRQAFNDLLMQMQRDRHGELGSLAKRQAVSKFPQRGRIQSLIRLRSLHRWNATQDQCRNQSLMNRSPEQSSIKNLREKFSEIAVASRSSTLKSVPQQMPSNSRSSDATCATTTDPQTLSKAAHLPKVEETSGESTTARSQISNTNGACDEQPKKQHLDLLERDGDGHAHEQPQEELDITERNGDFQEQLETHSDVNCHSESLKARNLESQEKASSDCIGKNEIPRERERKSGEHLFLGSQETSKPTEAVISNAHNEIVLQGQSTDDRQFLYFEHQETVEAVTSYNDCDEADYDPYYLGSNYDWISEIARPKSYWEDLRKTWYQEVLATSGNEEIRQLLERRTVSTFLTSDFKERMDKLMRARMQLEPADSVCGCDVEDDRSPEVIAFLQRHLQPHVAQEREEEEEEQLGAQEVDDEVEQEEEEEEEEEANPYFDTPSPSMQLTSPLMRSWSYRDGNDTGEDSDRLFSSSPSDTHQVAPSQVQSYKHSPRSSSSTNHPSLEMELICDLRGQMEQLHHEMAELRKSVLSCIDLQMKMHQSFSTGAQPAGMKNSDSSERSPWKRSCCMCYEMPVDSLLYRCGHMCTCMRCARELQWNGGKCPVCKAPIADVVRALDS